jgi:hypothetical protein
VSVRARFERFPATVKGAFVIRGEDSDPHQVSFMQGRLVRLPGGAGRVLPLEPVILDVAPHQDLFVPFEFSVADLDPGWYALESAVEVDGSPRTYPGGKRFVVPWPRSAVRKGTVDVRRKVPLEGGATVEVGSLKCQADSVTVGYTVSPPEPVEIRLLADGSRLPQLEEDFEPETGRGRLTVYPVPASARGIRVEVSPSRGRTRGSAPGFDVALP